MSAIVVEPDPVQFQQPELPPAEPCVVVIFGATGDLTRRKLMPALCRLTNEGCLESVRILGIGRNAMSEDEFQSFVHESLTQHIEHLDEAEWREFSGRLHYMAGELDDDKTYQEINARLEELASEGASRNRLFYLATPPSLFSTIVKRLGAAGLNKEDGNWSRIIIEKPFGRDLESAPLSAWRQCARHLADLQLGKMGQVCERVLSRAEIPERAPLVGAGVGRFLVKKLAARFGRRYRDFDDLVDTVPDVSSWASSCAPAVAVAILAQARLRKRR